LEVPHTLIHVSQAVAFIVGMALVFVSFTLFPREEVHTQNRLEEFWIKLDDYQRSMLSRHAAFMTQVAKFETRLLDRVFGNRLLSPRTGMMSAALSFLQWTIAVIPDPFISSRTHSVATLFVAIVMIIAVLSGLVELIRKYPFRAVLVFGLPPVLLLSYTYFFDIAARERTRQALLSTPTMESALFGSAICDVLFIALTRKLIRYCGEMTSAWKIAATVFLNILCALILLGPYLYMLFFASPLALEPRKLWLTVELVSATNILSALLASLFVFLCVLLLIHRLVWVPVNRVLFRMQEIGAVERRKLLRIAGIALLTWSGLASWLISLFKHF
jgi:hypothetical protein